MSVRVRVWDLPTRLFHWSLATTVVGLWITGQIGGAAMLWHFRLGYVALTLLIFRLIWGCIGGHWSRFHNFLYSPRSVIAYLKGRAPPEHTIGHTPLGAASVFGLLLILLFQVWTGLFSDDEIAWAGPLTQYASGGWISLATQYHKDIGQAVVLMLVALHVAAILLYWAHKRVNLVRPMVSGDKLVEQTVLASRDNWRSRLLAASVLVVSAVPALILAFRG